MSLKIEDRDPFLQAMQHSQSFYQSWVKPPLTVKEYDDYLVRTKQPTQQSFKSSPFKALASLGKTFWLWKEEIVRMWRFRKSNGITEGFHRKMKLIQRELMDFGILKIIELVLGFFVVKW